MSQVVQNRRGTGASACCVGVSGASNLLDPFRSIAGFGLVLLLVLACSEPRASAVSFPLPWRWSNPAPHGATVTDMAYSPARALGVQVAEFGQIFTSGDLDLWLPRDSPTTNWLRAVTFFGQRIIITGQNGTVLYADDVNHFTAGTLLDGPTTDWLEGVAASPQLVVAAGDEGAIYTSANGAVWKLQNSGTSTWFRGAAYGGGVFVVVGEEGAIFTSPTGTNWTSRTSYTTANLNRVSFANSRFTAVGEAGVAVSSTNSGATWFLEHPGATNDLQSASVGGVDRLLVGTHEVRLQDNLVWSDELAKTNGPPDWTYYAAIGQAGFFLIAGRSGLQSEGYQVNDLPYFWLTPYNSVRNWLWEVIRLPSFYAAVGDLGTIMTSENGVDWTLELVPAWATNTVFLGVGGNTNLLLAVGDSGSALYSPNILTNIVITNASGVITQSASSLGVLWFTLPLPATNDLQAVGVLSNSLFVIAGDKGVLYTSPTGTNGWTQRTTGTTSLLSSITEWPGGLVAVGDNGTLLTSSNGFSWNKVPSGTANWLYRVRWLNQQLLAVGENGTILTSTDAVTWSNRTSGTTLWLTDAVFIQDTWFVIGLTNTVLTSSNLVNWSNRGTITRKQIFGAATDSKQLVLVGVEGAILRSQVVPNLTPVSFLGYSRVYTNGPSPAYNVFLFGGAPDQRFTLDRGTNLMCSGWSTGSLLEIFDGSGTLFYVETLTGTNLPAVEYYRTTLTP
jgi:hypothetical protein